MAYTVILVLISTVIHRVVWSICLYTHTLQGYFTGTGAILRLPRCQWSNPEVHDDVIKWKHFPRNWPFVRGIHRSRWIPHTKASDAELWCFLWCAPEYRLSKQPWGWWFETLSWSLWRHWYMGKSTSCKPKQNTTKDKPCAISWDVICTRHGQSVFMFYLLYCIDVFCLCCAKPIVNM